MYSELEPTFAPDEIIYDTEYEPSSISCENKLGFTALCASCPLVALLGACPKEIRENTADNTLDKDIATGDEVVNDFLTINVVERNDSLDAVKEINKEPPVKVLRNEPIDIDTNPVAMQVHSTSRINFPEDTPIVTINFEKNEVLKPWRSYKDLLFDDTIPVVLAPQFTRQKEPNIKPALRKVTHMVVTAELKTTQILGDTVMISEDKPQYSLEVNDELVAERAVNTAIISQTQAIVEERIDAPVSVTNIEKAKQTLAAEIAVVPLIKETSNTIRLSSLIEKTVIPAIASAPSTVYIQAIVLPLVQIAALNATEKNDIPQEIVTIEYFESSTDILIMEKVPDEKTADSDNAMFIPAINNLKESDATAEILIMPEITKITDALDLSIPSIVPLGTPELLTNPLKTVAIKQSWSLSVLLGSLALLKLVSVNFSAKFYGPL
ncbi:MAG: hypothetical protein ACOH18_02630 [Candidatus Saccharimonadaceae bacterium]